MKTTGMIRRIDELGRVVIPKEIRRSMRLGEGSELEIITDEESLVLKKYSALSDLATIAGGYAEVLSAETGGKVLVCDRDRVLCQVGMGEIEDIPFAMEHAINERRKGLISLEEVPCPAYVEPLLTGGDLLGGIALVKTELTQDDIAKVGLVRRLLESQLDRG